MAQFSEKNLLKYYLLFSFYSVLAITFALFSFYGSEYWENSFFLTTLAIGTTYFYFHFFELSMDEYYNKELDHFFLFQSLSFVGITVETGISHFMYFVLFPSLIYMMIKTSAKDKKMGLVLFCLALSSFVIFAAIVKNPIKLFTPRGIVLMIFASSSLGILYFMTSKDHNSLFSKIFHIKGSEKSEFGKADRLFFHDLVNQTHGLNLFFNYKMALKEGLNSDELSDVAGEIKLMQTLIKDHFGLKHKNLVNVKDEISFYEVKDSLEHMIHLYLSPISTKFSCSYTGKLSIPIPNFRECMVNYPIFFRIITNIVKNIAEHKSEEVFFDFDYNELGLNIVVKNRIFKKHREESRLKDNLQKLVMTTVPNNKDHGMGIESIVYLSESIGGKFNFKIDGDYWISELFLPDPALKTYRNVA